MSASRAVLGMSLRDPDAFAEFLGMGLSPVHFEDMREREVFVSMLEEDRAGRRVELAGLCARRPEYAQEMILLLEEAPVAQSPSYFAEAVLTRCWKRDAERALIGVLSTVKHHDEFEGRARVQEEIIAVTDKLALGPTESRSGRMLKEVLEKVVGNVQEAMVAFGDGRPLGITTGMPTLDMLFSGGWRKKRVAALCARSGKGKTTIGLCFARNAMLAGHKVALFSVEADAEELVEKIVANEGECECRQARERLHHRSRSRPFHDGGVASCRDESSDRRRLRR
jgi:replicative DNA helicase